MTPSDREPTNPGMIRSISAVTLATSDMSRSMRFYQALGFRLRYGGEHASFTSFIAGASCLNLVAQTSGQAPASWGRVILHVTDVDWLYQHAIAQGLRPDTAPSDASWGERYFHIADPDGHQLSFAKPLHPDSRADS